jgi:threonine synthase
VPIVSCEAADRRHTLASAIRIGDPAHAAAVADAGAQIVTISDDEILAAWRLLATAEGVFCEPSSAAGIAALCRGDVNGERIVVTLTGHGLKDTDTAIREAPPMIEVEPDPDAILAASGG